jgi:hypothetical protein
MTSQIFHKFCLNTYTVGVDILICGYVVAHYGDVVAQFGDVVAQLAKATGRHQTEDAAVPGSNPAPPPSPERGQYI